MWAHCFSWSFPAMYDVPWKSCPLVDLNEETISSRNNINKSSFFSSILFLYLCVWLCLINLYLHARLPKTITCNNLISYWKRKCTSLLPSIAPPVFRHIKMWIFNNYFLCVETQWNNSKRVSVSSLWNPSIITDPLFTSYLCAV